MEIKKLKQKIREKVWKLMEKEKIVKFPYCYGRIPNFIGSEIAAKKVFETEVWQKAKVVKINPDMPQIKLREEALKENKILIMPTPRLKKGFTILKNLNRIAKIASTIKGAFKFGKFVNLDEIPKIDLIVIGSVAVDLKGGRIGKGHGYGELEYAILKELDLIDNTPIFTTVHEVQILDNVPMEKHDLAVDFISTNKRFIKVKSFYSKPKGIYWDLIDEKLIKEIPLLNHFI